MGRSSPQNPRNKLHVFILLILLIASTSAIEIENESYRLPTTIWPISYDVKLSFVYPTEAVTDVEMFDGTVDIVAKVTEETEYIYLHTGKELEMSAISISSLDGADIVVYEITDKDYNSDTEVNLWVLDSKLTKDQNIKISITFTGKLASDMYGVYKSTYTITNSKGDEETRILLATQFQSTHARKAFPCFDEPKFKAKFKITVDVPEGYGALCNTAMDDTTSTSKRIAFKETIKMSTYLIAFIVYEKASFGTSIIVVGTDEVRMTTWGRVSAMQRHHGDYSQTITHRILSELDDFTGIPYSTDGVIMKVDQAAIPDFAAGAMENWGLVTYRETGLLFDETNNTESSRKSVANVIAHELTHQWFGNLVTMDWWSDTWLNEGFARFFQYFLVNKINPQWRMMEQFVVDQQMVVFATDGLSSAVPLSREVNTHQEIDAQFSSAAYSKGGSVIRLLSIILGPQHFQTGLQKYLKSREYDTATPEQLFNILDENKPEDLNLPDGYKFTDLDIWISKPGFPLITFKRDNTNKIVAITQERFILDDTTASDNTIYPVYLEWSTSDGQHTKQWLVKKEISSTEALPESDDDWFIVNNTGYFRIDYDIQNWRNIYIELTQKNLRRIAPLDRATLVDNALNLARIDRFQYPCALTFIRYLQNETDYIPWTAALSGLSFLHRMLITADEEGLFNKFVETLIEEVYEFLGFQDRGDHLEKIHRANTLSWACRVGVESCHSTAVALLEAYVDKGQMVPANLRSVSYCYGIKTGSDNLWWKVWQKLQENEDASERSILISALGCSKAYSTLYMYLEQSLASDGVIRQQDASSVYSAVYTNPDGVEVALDFLIENFDRIEKTYVSMNALRNVVTGVANYLTTEEQYNKMLKLVTENPSALKDIGTTALNTINTNRKWLEKNEEEVFTALRKFLSNEESSVEPESDVLC